MAELMPLPLTISCFSKIQIGFTFLVPTHLGNPRKRAVKRVCVCVCLWCCSGLKGFLIDRREFYFQPCCCNVTFWPQLYFLSLSWVGPPRGTDTQWFFASFMRNLKTYYFSHILFRCTSPSYPYNCPCLRFSPLADCIAHDYNYESDIELN